MRRSMTRLLRRVCRPTRTSFFSPSVAGWADSSSSAPTSLASDADSGRCASLSSKGNRGADEDTTQIYMLTQEIVGNSG